ncbi:MAG: hypothetical protein DHS20C13_28480 [Thermodesulfobacteriota bacterium]|nr:MAG: hypothetical protein DHS20C13_28480 [Thermodesulfobacteriota bacterium]
MPFPAITGCISFDNEGQCTECDTHYILEVVADGDNLCISQFELPYCRVRKKINECYECDEHFIPVTVGDNVICKANFFNPYGFADTADEIS